MYSNPPSTRRSSKAICASLKNTFKRLPLFYSYFVKSQIVKMNSTLDIIFDSYQNKSGSFAYDQAFPEDEEYEFFSSFTKNGFPFPFEKMMRLRSLLVLHSMRTRS
jgi:hypothetical protein